MNVSVLGSISNLIAVDFYQLQKHLQLIHITLEFNIYTVRWIQSFHFIAGLPGNRIKPKGFVSLFQFVQYSSELFIYYWYMITFSQWDAKLGFSKNIFSTIIVYLFTSYYIKHDSLQTFILLIFIWHKNLHTILPYLSTTFLPKKPNFLEFLATYRSPLRDLGCILQAVFNVIWNKYITNTIYSFCLF